MTGVGSAGDALFEIRSSATSPDTYMSEVGFAAALADHDAAVRADQIARDTEKIDTATRAKKHAEAELRLQIRRSDRAWEVIETDYWRNHYDALVAENDTLTAQLEDARTSLRIAETAIAGARAIEPFTVCMSADGSDNGETWVTQDEMLAALSGVDLSAQADSIERGSDE